MTSPWRSSLNGVRSISDILDMLQKYGLRPSQRDKMSAAIFKRLGQNPNVTLYA